jgi:hypothetical protein
MRIRGAVLVLSNRAKGGRDVAVAGSPSAVSVPATSVLSALAGRAQVSVEVLEGGGWGGAASKQAAVTMAHHAEHAWL